jgi:hypothetical protein
MIKFTGFMLLSSLSYKEGIEEEERDETRLRDSEYEAELNTLWGKKNPFCHKNRFNRTSNK